MFDLAARKGRHFLAPVSSHGEVVRHQPIVSTQAAFDPGRLGDADAQDVPATAGASCGRAAIVQPGGRWIDGAGDVAKMS